MLRFTNLDVLNALDVVAGVIDCVVVEKFADFVGERVNR